MYQKTFWHVCTRCELQILGVTEKADFFPVYEAVSPLYRQPLRFSEALQHKRL